MATFPSFDLTDFDVTKLDPRQLGDAASAIPGATRLAGLARDGAYVGIGLAILGLQRAGIQRRHMSRYLARLPRR